ncbi:hypothetical protein CW304_03225 [Bacillus sp. UFRGS-B20]|nr:hypothetical protein CW304_03225 [Bacillus sp. UFRGS-B20]
MHHIYFERANKQPIFYQFIAVSPSIHHENLYDMNSLNNEALHSSTQVSHASSPSHHSFKFYLFNYISSLNNKRSSYITFHLTISLLKF